MAASVLHVGIIPDINLKEQKDLMRPHEVSEFNEVLFEVSLSSECQWHSVPKYVTLLMMRNFWALNKVGSVIYDNQTLQNAV
jgi:hypothetical protein